MAQSDGSATSFEELWQSVIDQPIRPDEIAEADDGMLTADALVAWLRQIADDSLADGLIAPDDHAELRRCSDTYARVLGAIAPDVLRARLMTTGETET